MGGRRGNGLRFGGWLLLLSGAWWIGARDAASQPQRLQERARARGTVRVIVSLREPFLPEGRLSGLTAVQNQRTRIAAAQDRLLSRMASLGATGRKRFASIPFVAMEVDSAALSALYSDPEVADVQEDVPVPLLETSPPTSKRSGTGDLPAPPLDLGASTVLIQANLAWSRGYTGAGKVIAVLDTGIQKNHPFLSGKVVSEACYSTNDAASSSSSLCPGGDETSTARGSGLNCDPSLDDCDHGTHVAGIAAGTGPSFSGVARGANLLSIQVFSRFDDQALCGTPPCVLSWTSDQVRALERVYALRSTLDIAAVNMSLGGSRYTSAAECDALNAATKAAIDNLRFAGIATVIASGNDGFTDALSAPACISSAVSVGSTGFSDRVSFFSNEAPFLSLYAPGEGIRSSIPIDQFGIKSGTSMATPHVAGAWALLRQRAPASSVTQALSALVSSGLPIVSTAGTWSTPRIRLNGALDSLSHSQMDLESPLEGEVVSTPFLVRGWAIDRASTAGAGIDTVRVWAFPAAGGAGIFLGAASLGIARPDIGAMFGPQFDHAGYELNVATALVPGSYRLEVSARSTITGAFDVVERRNVVVPGPRMALDVPVANAVLSWPFRVSGWAVHLGAATGTGVDLVHVWAHPVAGGAGTFLGSATMGVSRPDVAAFFGDPRFGPSGFDLSSTAILAPGSYQLQVWARSTVTGSFDNAVNRLVTVAPLTRAAIDMPASGSFLAAPFTVAGWAFNTGSPGTVGVDDVLVEARPAGGGAPLVLGHATLGISRPDVSSFFGQPAFEKSGFRLEVASPLPDGAYLLRVSFRSTATGTYDAVFELPVALGSAPRMGLDLPSPGAPISFPMTIAGWALDLAAPAGTGIDLVHVWVFPADGSPAAFLGSATLGIQRPDVGSSFGQPRFNSSGFRLNAAGPLPSGQYLLVVYARSTVAKSFNVYRAVTIQVPIT